MAAEHTELEFQLGELRNGRGGQVNMPSFRTNPTQPKHTFRVTMSKVAQIPNPSLAPLGMYDLKPVFDLDAKVDIPDCMYR